LEGDFFRTPTRLDRGEKTRKEKECYTRTRDPDRKSRRELLQGRRLPSIPTASEDVSRKIKDNGLVSSTTQAV